MNLFELYADRAKHAELTELFNFASTQHPFGLAANFLEKDLWVTEVLRLLYDEQLLGAMSIAFKGGTALSKCWHVIQRFSEDIDLSIHWAELSGLTEQQEFAAWQQSIKNDSQAKKFRRKQQQLLQDWTEQFVDYLNQRFSAYQIEGLQAVVEPDSAGEKIDIHYPRMTKGTKDYQLDHILLEFGGRNRGKPTKTITTNCYLSEVKEFAELPLPQANVQAYENDFVLWEKLTALHQFSTQTKEPNPTRLARHWYDVSCLLKAGFADAFNSSEAMQAVVEMKKHRWSMPGVDYEAILSGRLSIVPQGNRLQSIIADHKAAINGQMFFQQPESFELIMNQLADFQDKFNSR
ncbi:nucleotidyl transferase AbiEii/AbiGii toxin family protein [Alkalimonas collagenimarina]|uniref:Nucleotidyl transferase AbiEii/AbiGii toxin family protein n=1 Tax=Alkalimonas collagenimarina TaxID=400390 RepID=A0ABT9H1Y2_9GAMM|nr:nucleotidyl transferase AbiEii/AbiGii toxin family protein [Alkalimonas collagenimarina]MDP4536905.1 nucleotidyl transferase AbiEii/AbiGii toxin family protein [Alkalimonas collagenimarina]